MQSWDLEETRNYIQGMRDICEEVIWKAKNMIAKALNMKDYWDDSVYAQTCNKLCDIFQCMNTIIDQIDEVTEKVEQERIRMYQGYFKTTDYTRSKTMATERIPVRELENPTNNMTVRAYSENVYWYADALIMYMDVLMSEIIMIDTKQRKFGEYITFPIYDVFTENIKKNTNKIIEYTDQLEALANDVYDRAEHLAISELKQPHQRKTRTVR